MTPPTGRARRVRAEHRRDAGLSLIELLVAMGIFAVVGTLLMTLVVTTFRSSAGTRTRLADIDQVRVAMDAMTKTLRTAVAPAQFGASCTGCSAAFDVLTVNQVRFWANLGDSSRPTKITYQVVPKPDGTVKLVETRQLPLGTTGVASAWATPGTQRVLVDGVLAPTAPVFAYADNAGLPTTSVGSVHSVDVSLPVRTSSALSGATTSEHHKVFLPNSVWGH